MRITWCSYEGPWVLKICLRWKFRWKFFVISSMTEQMPIQSKGLKRHSYKMLVDLKGALEALLEMSILAKCCLVDTSIFRGQQINVFRKKCLHVDIAAMVSFIVSCFHYNLCKLIFLWNSACDDEIVRLDLLCHFVVWFTVVLAWFEHLLF